MNSTSDQGENHSFTQFVQYITALTIQQDIWIETGKALINFFGAKLVAFGKYDANGDIHVNHWTFSEMLSHGADPLKTLGSADSQHNEIPSEIRTAIAETLQSGFLTTVTIPNAYAIAVLPIMKEHQNVAAMLVGQHISEPFTKGQLNVYLAIAGLVATNNARLEAEKELKNHRNRLEKLVKTRTKALKASNATLQQEIKHRKQAELRTSHLNRLLRTIKNVDQLIVREKDRDRLIQGACNLLVEMRGFHSAWITIISETGTLISLVEAGMGDMFNPLLMNFQHGKFPSCARKALSQSTVVVVPNTASACMDCPLAVNYAGRGGMTVRLESGIKAYGLLCASIPASLINDPEEQKLFQEIARDIAFALHHIESEEKYRKLFENAVVGTNISTAQGKALDVNGAMSRITGYTREEFFKLDLAELYANPEDRNRFLETMALNGLVEEFEIQLRKKTGERFWTSISSKPITYDGQEAFLNTVLDITKRIRSEKRIEGLSLLKESLLGSNSLDLKMKRITDGVVEILEADFARIWLVQQGDLCDSGCMHAKVVKGPHVCRFRNRCLHLISSSGRYTHLDGSHRRVPFGCYKIGRVAAAEEPGFLTNDVTRDPCVHDHAWAAALGLKSFAGYRLLSHEGIPIGVLALFSRRTLSSNEERMLKTLANTAAIVIQVSRSIEEMGRLNLAMEAKNAELEQVVYVASHDLRSPLVNIDGYSKELAYNIEEIAQKLSTSYENAHLAIAPLLEKEIPECLHFIQSSASKMDTLLSGLLRLSRSGRAVLTMAPQDMNTLISNVVDSIKFQIREAQVRIQVDQLPPCYGDGIQLNQVFSNLLSNALKYREPSRPGFVRISGHQEGKRSIYCVEDNGIGIAPAHLNKIFEIFHRLQPDKGDGDGLGLTIVKRIMGRLEGSIRVESKEGSGTRFYLTLPADATSVKAYS